MAERKAPARKPKAPVPEPSAEPEAASFVGELPDDTPNEHYTLSGVIAGKPVPEHDK